jgi:hypothetical protein
VQLRLCVQLLALAEDSRVVAHEPKRQWEIDLQQKNASVMSDLVVAGACISGILLSLSVQRGKKEPVVATTDCLPHASLLIASAWLFDLLIVDVLLCSL